MVILTQSLLSELAMKKTTGFGIERKQIFPLNCSKKYTSSSHSKLIYL
jgi:hypothetical protein